MPSNSRRRTRKGSAKGNSIPRPVISMTQAEAFERSVVRGGDATCLRGKVLVNSTGSTTPGNVLTIHPASLGARSLALCGIFSRYRFKYVRFKFLSSPATLGQTALGVYDDATSAEGQPPTTLSGITELRASGTSLYGQTVPTSFEWFPADRNLWYYTQPGVSGSDFRLYSSGVLYLGGTASSVAVGIEFDYCVVFKGAVDIGSQ
jgi:hypothetical protein